MLKALYRKAQYLSLDIVLGAVILLRFFSSQLSVELSIYVYALLAGSVWLIYTIDHLRDAKKSKVGGRARYTFHLKHYRVLRITTVVVLLIMVLLLFFVETSILLSGLILAGLAGIYLLLQSHLSRRGLKEVYVAIVYSVGILLAPFTMRGEVHWDLIWLLFLLTVSNLILFSWFEGKEDLSDGFDSIATVLKNGTMERVILFVLSLGIASILLMQFSLITCYFLFAFILYTFLFIRKKWSMQYYRYRTIGDGVFLLPLVFDLL